MNVDVVIAGAGPNGLLLACELSLAGIRPVVLDSLTGPDPEPRANGLIGRVVPLLDRRGLHERLTGSAAPPEPTPRYLYGGFSLDLSGLADNPVYVLGVPQLGLVRELVARAEELGIDIRWGHSLVGLDQDAETVTATVDGPDGESAITARYLVGADGGRSTTRKLAGIGFPGVTNERMVSRSAWASLPSSWVDPATGVIDVPGYGRLPTFLHNRTEHGLFVYAPFPGRAPMIGTGEWDAPEDEGPMTVDELRASASRVLGGVDVPVEPWTGDGPALLRRTTGGNSRLADRYRAGRVLLVGDAAHVHSAMGGPGLNLGLQDAVNLGWKLAGAVSGWAPDGLLDSYEAERRPVSERVLMQTRAQSALIAPGPEVTALRELFGELLTQPGVLAHVAELLSAADVHYAPGDHPLVGRWAPDVTIETSGGVRRLAELTRDARPLLLDLTADGALAAAGWPDRVAAVAGRPVGPAPATALLVRPDGYVAWASDATHPDRGALADAARRWFGVERVAAY